MRLGYNSVAPTEASTDSPTGIYHAHLPAASCDVLRRHAHATLPLAEHWHLIEYLRGTDAQHGLSSRPPSSRPRVLGWCRVCRFWLCITASLTHGLTHGLTQVCSMTLSSTLRGASCTTTTRSLSRGS